MKYTLAEQIRRRNQLRARQDATAQKRKPSLPAVIYTAFGIRKADELRERIEKAEAHREQGRQAARRSSKNTQNQKSPETDSSRQASQPKMPSYDPLASIRPPRPKPAPAPTSDIRQAELPNPQPLPDLQHFYQEPDWPGGRPLTQGQKLHVDHLLSLEDDTLVRDMLIGIRRDGMPSKKYLNDYLAQFAQWGWDEISDERTMERLDIIRQSDWDKLLDQADAPPIEAAAQDLANDRIESVQVIDASTGQVLLNRMGVRGAAGEQYVGLQQEDIQKFQGRDLIFVHNHPNGTAASEADLQTAFLAGAELLLVVTPQGYEYVYIRGESSMVRVREGDASYEVEPATAAEHDELAGRSQQQAVEDRRNPPELIMRQENIADLNEEEKLMRLQVAYNSDSPETPMIATQFLNDETPEVQAWAKLAILEYEYGIVLSTKRIYGDNTIKGWSYQAIASVFEGVQDTIDAMWTIRDRLNSYAVPQDRASFFRAVVGPLDIRLAPEGPEYYAETFGHDSDGFRDNSYNVIKFFKPGWENRGDWFKFNLVHEIGHVISNRVAGYPLKKISILNGQFELDPSFRQQGWGAASGTNWIEERNRLRESATPVVTRQFNHEETDPTYLVNEEWADMFLFWVYDDRAGQTTFSHPNTGQVIVAGDRFDTYGEARRFFMEKNLPQVINARYRIQLSPEELVQLAGWGDDSTVLPRVNARADNFDDAEMRSNLEGVINLEATDINENPTIVAGKLRPGEATVILGRSRSYPYMVLNISGEGEIGWTHIGLLDLDGMDIGTLLLLSDNAIAELQGLEN